MKYIFVIILSLLLALLPHEREKEDLYLLYSSKDPRMGKGYMDIRDDKWLVITFEICHQQEHVKNIAFSEIDSTQRLTVDFKKLSGSEIKNIDWLTKNYLEFFNYFKGKYPGQNEDGSLKHFDLNERYDSIYIVMPDSTRGEAMITKVKQLSFYFVD